MLSEVWSDTSAVQREGRLLRLVRLVLRLGAAAGTAHAVTIRLRALRG